MIRQDYLLREVERVMEFALRALGLRVESPVEDFNRFLEENSLQLTGLSFDTLTGTPAGTLVSLFYDPDGRNLGRLVACGALLVEAADSHRRDDEGERARELLSRATEILAFATSQFGGEAGYQIAKRLEDLRERIPLFEFPPESATQLDTLCSTTPPRGDQI